MGGTFDPVHNGHLSAAREVRAAAALGQVWLLPNAHPPHRRAPLASAEDRMRMVEIAVMGEPHLSASRLEVDRGGVSYTIETIRELARRFPEESFEWLLGADAAQHIGEWHEAKAVLAEASFLIFNRPGTSLSEDELERLGFSPQRTRVVHLQTLDIAAHEIRERLIRGESIDDLVPTGVAAYIREHHLYAPDRATRQLG